MPRTLLPARRTVVHASRAVAVGSVAAALTLSAAPLSSAAPVSRALPARATTAVGAGHVVSAVSAARATPAPARRYRVDLVLARTPGGRRDLTTLADLRAALRNVDAFYDRNTGGRVRFVVGRTHGWSRASTSCSLDVPRRLADRFGWSRSSRRLVVAYQPSWCPFVGEAEISGRHILLARVAATTSMAHEIGHTLGLTHSNLSKCTLAFARRCTTKADDRRSLEYGDATDLMGGAETAGRSRRFDVSTVRGTLNPLQLRALGVPLPTTRISLSSPRAVTVTLRARVDRLGWSAARLTWGRRTFWLSYLAGTGIDDPLAGSAYATRPFHGELVVQTRRGAGSLLVPVSRSSSAGAGMPDWTLAALPNGRTLQVRVLGPRAVLTVTPPDPARPASVSVASAHAGLAVSWVRGSTSGITGYVVEAHAGSTVVTRTVPASSSTVAIAVPRAGQPYRVRVYPLRGALRGTPAQATRSVASWPALGDIPSASRAEPVPGDASRWRVVLDPPPDGWGAVRSATVIARNLSEPGSFDLETGVTSFDSGPAILDQYETGPGPYRVVYTIEYRDGGSFTELVSASYTAPD